MMMVTVGMAVVEVDMVVGGNRGDGDGGSFVGRVLVVAAVVEFVSW